MQTLYKARTAISRRTKIVTLKTKAQKIQVGESIELHFAVMVPLR